MENVKELRIEAERHGEITVELIDLPKTVRGCVLLNEGKYTIVLNKGISKSERLKAYIHELEHIANQDFNLVGVKVATIENIRHAENEPL